MPEKTKFTAFRCPTELYNKLLKESDNKSKIIVDALESFQSKEFREDLTKAYIQLTKLFKQLSRHFTPEFGQDTLEINQFIYYIKEYIINIEAIDNTNKILELE